MYWMIKMEHRMEKCFGYENGTRNGKAFAVPYSIFMLARPLH